MGLWSENMSFVNPSFLILLGLIPLAGYWYYTRNRRMHTQLKVSSLAAFNGQSSLRGKLTILLPILRALAFAALVIAMARPQLALKEEDIQADGIDIFMVMDLSSSMLAQDFKPDRLEVSKRVAMDFVDKRPYDRIGLAVFAGEAFTQCPLTTDHTVVKGFLSSLECGILQDGTAIGMGLASAVNRLKESDAKSKVVILLTDGVNNAGYIKPETAAELAKEFNIKVYTIGVGSEGDAVAPISKKRGGGFIYGLTRVQIDEQLLRNISYMTGAKYFRATNARALAQIYEQINQMEKTKIDVTTIKRYSEEFYRFAFLGLIFLMLEILLRNTVLRTLP